MMKRIRNFITKSWKNDFIHGFLIIFSGSALAQALPLLATIYLARVFPNETFGLFFLYSTSVLILSIIATLKYELAIVLPRNEIESINLLALSILISLVISVLVLILVVLLNAQLASLLGDERIGFWLNFLPLSILFSGIFQATSYWFLWQKKFKSISLSKISKSAGTAGFQIGMGLTNLTKYGLIPGLIFGQALAAIINVRIVYGELKSKFRFISYRKMITLAIRHKNLPIFSTLLGFFNTTANNLPIFFLTKFFGVTITSYYGMANRLIAAPMGLISQSVNQVFFKKASVVKNENGDLNLLIKKIYLNLFKVGLIPFIALYIFTPFIIKIAIGSQWSDASTYVRILIPWLFFGFLTSPLSSLITVLKRQDVFVVYEICILALRFAALYIGYKLYNNPIISVLLFSMVGILFYIGLMLLFLYFSNKERKQKNYYTK